uniref:Transmembrane protein n=1 Tax=Chromera velia CCMP2878 TaxID=1169474 RepID=A0A0G4IDJ3_9ALVE|eukprot:Cvel_13292.t1-p1 / transcript=Cvel_13292.t1 / gene=Cvel_13292 / organism=Chromera_velia_CCMP2878 / gene_product=hypothetical protein / transcript_product=hypothetical protein / location=Cvel_scaffold902:13539-15074(-) / protein_length=301 / sequence_SO=supercontig / SO=protein_coding / is_pseudo=false
MLSNLLQTLRCSFTKIFPWQTDALMALWGAALAVLVLYAGLGRWEESLVAVISLVASGVTRWEVSRISNAVVGTLLHALIICFLAVRFSLSYNLWLTKRWHLVLGIHPDGSSSDEDAKETKIQRSLEIDRLSFFHLVVCFHLFVESAAVALSVLFLVVARRNRKIALEREKENNIEIQRLSAKEEGKGKDDGGKGAALDRMETAEGGEGLGISGLSSSHASSSGSGTGPARSRTPRSGGLHGGGVVPLQAGVVGPTSLQPAQGRLGGQKEEKGKVGDGGAGVLPSGAGAGAGRGAGVGEGL